MAPDLHYGHPRMPVSQRAKIFMPFDPLEGFRAALAVREREVERSYDRPSARAVGEPYDMPMAFPQDHHSASIESSRPS